MGRVTDIAPAGLVPAAWGLTIAAHADIVSARTLFVGLVVMTTVLVAFAAVGFGEMDGPVLSAWRQVLIAGLLVTALGTIDMAVGPDRNPTLPAALYAWMVLPAAAYVHTGRRTRHQPYRGVYLAAAAGSVLGFALYGLAHVDLVGGTGLPLVGIAVLGAGQTAGIVAAAVQNTASASTLA